MTKRTHAQLMSVVEGALMIALVVVCGFLRFPMGTFNGGSVSPAMIPIIIYALRHGALKGMLVGAIGGLLKFLIAHPAMSTTAYVPLSAVILDYVVAYGVLGVAGIMKNRTHQKAALHGVYIGVALRFIVHVISGVINYFDIAANQDGLLGIGTNSPIMFILVYNIPYLLVSFLLTMIVAPMAVNFIKGYKTGDRKNRNFK